MELQFSKESPCFFRSEEFVEDVGFVRIEVVEHHPDADCIRVVLIDECLHLLDELLLAAALCHLNVSPADEWLAHHEEVPCTVALVSIVVPSDRSRAGRERVADVLVERLVTLVEADDRTSWVVWLVVEVEDIFHPTNEGGVCAGFDHPGV